MKVGIDKVTGERVAIKIVNKELVEREETLNNEIEILSKVDHENIVRMHAIFDTPEHLFIIMELCVPNGLCSPSPFVLTLRLVWTAESFMKKS